jgi:glyoxylase-like metal-dependent hydrolase (beta-lactamase superfamily II)
MLRWIAAFAFAFAPLPSSSAEADLHAAVTTLGGIDRLAALDNWIVEGSGRENLSAELQGLSPDKPTWRPHYEKVAVLRASGSVAWQRRTPRNDRSVRDRRFMYTPESRGVVDWTSGFGRMARVASPAATREGLMRRVPHVLLLEAATRELDGVNLGFAENPVLLRSAEYRVDMPGRGVSTVRWTWSDWKPDAQLGYAPKGHRVEVDGVVFQEVTYSRYEAGSAEAAEMLRVPDDLPQRPMNDAVSAVGPAEGQVAPGVHVAAVRGFRAMFVETRDFVVVFDALASGPGLESIPASAGAVDAAANELIDIIARTCPGKPIRYVVISHHHSDHVGGIRPFIRAGATFLVPPDAAAIVRAAGGGAEVVSRRRVLADGKLEVRAVGANPHTDQNLFVWLPRERVLLNGDLFYFEEGSPFPPSGRETMNRFFARWPSANKLEPKAIYGVHYEGAAGAAALQRALIPPTAGPS